MIKSTEENYLKTENNYEKKLIGNYFCDVDKIKEEKVGPDMEIGGIISETPISKFLRYNFNKDLQNYVYHKDVYLYDRKEKLILFILKDSIVITDTIESGGLERCDTLMSNSNVTNISSSFLLKIDYKTVNLK
jgi:hypothetical protein